jgi:hypothetical protein
MHLERNNIICCLVSLETGMIRRMENITLQALRAEGNLKCFVKTSIVESKVASATNIMVGDIADFMISRKLRSASRNLSAADSACSLYNFFNFKVEQVS